MSLCGREVDEPALGEGIETHIFFTFWGMDIITKKHMDDLQFTWLGNTAMHPPGAVVRLNEADFGGSVRLNSFHDINYPTVMALGRTMGWQMPEEVAIWGIEMAVFDEFGEELTTVVADAVATVVHEVLAFLDSSNAVIDERPGVP